jgi:DNA polymerase III epsilon subunit-like protein
MRICAIDFEATGLKVEEDRITEVGAVLFDIDRPEPIAEYGTLVYSPDYPRLSEEVIEVTGITDLELIEKGISFSHALLGLVSMFDKNSWPDYFLAHNKAYDENLFKAEMKRHKAILLNHFAYSDLDGLFQIPWLCSIEDVQHPAKLRCKKLSHLALDYGLTVDPTSLHRAVDDVELLVRMCKHAQFDFEEIAARSKMPSVIIRACVPSPFGKSGDGGVGKDKARACGFSWQSVPGSTEVFKNCWVKKVKENEIDEEKKKLESYEVAIVKKA